MTNVLTPNAKQQFFDNNGHPLVGGKLFSYQAGTTTKLATYTGPGAALNTNPIILDFRGECSLWIPPNIAYKFVLATAADTDPPTAPIWSVDNVVSSQLITLYGGVDTGTTNAYVLTFTANFTSYTDGIVIYWIPSNTNGGASTINVNGLGAVAITNQDGSALTPNQLFAGQVATIMYQGGAFLLLSSGIAPSLLSGSFVPTWTGFSAVPTGTMFYTKIGPLVIATFGATNTVGTSNATLMTITNLPAAIRPQTDANARQVCMITDNGVQAAGAFSFGVAPATMVFYKGTAPPSAAGFTAAGLKGFSPYTMLLWSVL